MGAAQDNVREQPWRLLRWPWHVAQAIADQPIQAVQDALAQRHRPAIQTFLDNQSYLERMTPLPLVQYQPSNIALLEPVWDAAFNMGEIHHWNWVGRPTEVPAPDWPLPADPYDAQRPIGSDLDDANSGTQVIDHINVFLHSGLEHDALGAATTLDGDQALADALGWAASYWAGPEWREHYARLAHELVDLQPEAVPPTGDVIAVLRHGAPQLSWRLA